ncbi:MAG TPA: SDR family oxidoreductase [Geminicoccaceae bacterium]|nr:SDR family oxidoreductase [Geminicoccus sp.]HMU50726.1 SDR family oxidoreductase [Geminicoccaceae bacterium]
MTGTLLCFGYGYTATTLARRLLARGWTVRGTTRSADKAAVMRAAGIEPFLFDRDRPLPREAFDSTSHALTSIAPDETGDPVLDLHAAELGGIGWCGYLGTTAVYGNHDGGWVDETTPLQPSIARADRRARAEAAWQASGLPAHIFRLAGIYGPGRNALVNLRRGTARRIVKPGQVFSRTHVEDISATLEASIERPRPGAIYNVCDDEPSPPQDVIAFAAELLGIEPPPELPYDTAELPPLARSFYRDNRRVRNELIKRELGVRLAYPTYREGLRALLRVECP